MKNEELNFDKELLKEDLSKNLIYRTNELLNYNSNEAIN
jgi:hypothetical protein